MYAQIIWLHWACAIILMLFYLFYYSAVFIRWLQILSTYKKNVNAKVLGYTIKYPLPVGHISRSPLNAVNQAIGTRSETSKLQLHNLHNCITYTILTSL